MEWISVEKGLPDELGRYLVIADGKQYVMRFAENAVGWRYWEAEGRFKGRNEDVTHWACLPEPPKENTDGQ